MYDPRIGWVLTDTSATRVRSTGVSSDRLARASGKLMETLPAPTTVT